MATYRLEMNTGQDIREVEAFSYKFEGPWMVFFQQPPQGGTREYWRVKIDCVVSMETKP